MYVIVQSALHLDIHDAMATRYLLDCVTSFARARNTLRWSTGPTSGLFLLNYDFHQWERYENTIFGVNTFLCHVTELVASLLQTVLGDGYLSPLGGSST